MGLQVPLVCPLFQFPEAKHGDACSDCYFDHKLQSGVQVYEIILALLSILKYGYVSANSFHVGAAVRAGALIVLCPAAHAVVFYSLLAKHRTTKAATKERTATAHAHHPHLPPAHEIVHAKKHA